MENKILMFYINAIHEGGAERVILQLAYRFSLVGYQSILVTSFVDINEYEVPPSVIRLTLEERQTGQSKLKRNIRRISELRKLCKKYQPSAIISFMAEANARALIATIGLPIIRIISVRNDPKREYSGKSGWVVGKILLPFADGCVFQTEEAKKWFPKRLQKKSKIIYNEISEKFYDTIFEGGSDIVTLGRLSTQKNQKLLIDAFLKISESHPFTNLKIYGIGDQEEEIREYIEMLGIGNRVKLMGLTLHPETVLKFSAAFVLCSDYEGMPNALMEALAVGVPSISTDCPCGGPATLIENGYNGILIPVGDKEKLQNALLDIIDDQAYGKRLGENARKKSYEFHPDVVFQDWKAYIESYIQL